MAVSGAKPESSKSVRYLRLLARISAWLLLATVAVQVFSGWGITHTGVIYKATFGLVDRRLADAIHREVNLPLAIFFLIHVLINIDLLFRKNKSRKSWRIHLLLILLGLALMGIVVYVEYWSVL
jgi:hypothetical protein